MHNRIIRTFGLGINLKLLIVIALFSSLVFLTFGYVRADSDTAAVWGDFTNSMKMPPGVNPDVNKSTSATFFGGHVKVSPDASGVLKEPSGGGYKLVESSFGQAVSNQIPYPDFQQEAIDWSKKRLYYEHATLDDPEFLKDNAAFRYKAFLYEVDDENKLAAQFLKMSELWTDDDRDRALEAAQELKEALKYDPWNEDLRNAILDIYYDITVADLTRATEMMVEVQKAALGEAFGYIASPGEFLISKEIDLLADEEGGIILYDKAMEHYFDLMKDPMGVDMYRVNAVAAAENKPFGYYLFKTEVPERSPYAPLYKDKDTDQMVSVLPDDGTSDSDDKYNRPELFHGYKDLILLFNIQRSAADAAAKLARLYALRSDSGDADKARAIIGKAQQKLYTDGSILDSIFTSTQLDGVDPDSGLVEAKACWAQGLSALSGVKSFLDGNANPLGLDKDFLALHYTLLPNAQQKFSDTYQFFRDEMLFQGGTPSVQLLNAINKYNDAVNAYKTFQINKDQVATELDNIRNQYGLRLQKIVGNEPSIPGYDTMEPAEGSEIWVQISNIELANLRVDHNRKEIEVLQGQIQNEIERRGKEKGINNLIQQTIIKYGNRQASLTKELAAVNAAQAAASAIVSGASNAILSSGASMAMATWHAGVQIMCETMKGDLQARKERMAAAEQATIHYQNDQISAVNSEARVKDLFLGMKTLEIESMEASVVLVQEAGILQGLLDEKAYLETRWEESDSSLATRYFADPAHRIISNNKIIEAGFAFDIAQYWVYMMARALDYRMNERFVAPSMASGDTRAYTSNSVFKLRNALELEHMVATIDNHAINNDLGDRSGHTFVKFSLREDYLGFYEGVDDEDNPFTYPDPHTGSIVPPLDAFKSYLKEICKNEKSDHLTGFDKVVKIEFSTVRTNFEENFFSDGKWNEKIKWLAVKIHGAQDISEVRIYLEQSGSAFIRNQTRGTTPDPKRPDFLEGEMTGYPIRHWYFENNAWKSKPAFGFSSINAIITEDPNVPPEAWQSAEFHELSPAVTKWVLEIPTRKLGRDVVNLDTVTDIEIWFYNYYIARN